MTLSFIFSYTYKRLEIKSIVLVICCVFLFISGKEPAKKFTIVVLPDTQYYTNDPSYYHCAYQDSIYIHQTQWIVENEITYNIKYVAHLGDVTNQGHFLYMWDRALEAHQLLVDAGIPFSVLPGNHDYQGYPDHVYRRVSTYYNEKFDSFEIPWYSGKMDGRIDNTYNTFQVQGFNFLVVNLEYAATKQALCWADQVIAAHPNHRVIIATHCYMSYDATHCDCTKSSEGPPVGSDGWNIWDELVQRHSNIFMVLSGHMNDSKYRKRIGLAGNVIHEILTNYQYEYPLGAITKCGNGWLRLLEFYPKENRIDIITKSVEEGNEMIFENGEPQFYRPQYSGDVNSEDHQYSIFYDMTSPKPAYLHTPNTTHFKDRALSSEHFLFQKSPVIAADTLGGFVVAWTENNDSTLLLCGYTAGGCKRFDKIQLNNSNSESIEHPGIAMDKNGNFVVVWQSNTNENDIFMRGFDRDGIERFSINTVNTITNGSQRNPAIAMYPNGDFVVVWEDDNDSDANYEILGSGYNSVGQLMFGPVMINSDSLGQQLDPKIITDNNDMFWVVWENNIHSSDNFDILGSGYNNEGVLEFGPITINSSYVGIPTNPDIALDENGNFVVVWQNSSNENDIFVRGFYPDGVERIANNTINVSTIGSQKNPSITMENNGNFWVAWEDDGDNDGFAQIYALGFDNMGVPMFDPLLINNELLGHQQHPNIDMNINGSFITVWEGDSDNDGYAQIMVRSIQMCDLSVESIGGGIVYTENSSYPTGDTVVITAIADPGMRFSHWTGGVEDPNSATTFVFIDADYTVTAWFYKFELDIRVMLEGPFNGTNLNADLISDAASFPFSQPFNAFPWNYKGSESITSIPNINIVDWTLVELRGTSGDSATTVPDSVFARKAGFILSDGKIVGLDGKSPLRFISASIDSNLYIVIHHRNHLSTISSIVTIDTLDNYTYDFTSSENQSSSGFNAVKELSPGIWGMLAADGDGNGLIDSLDLINIWKVQAGEEGYKSGDFNLDFEVDNKDKDNFWMNNNGINSSIPE